MAWHGTRHTGCSYFWRQQPGSPIIRTSRRAVFHTPDIPVSQHPGNFTSYFNLPECPRSWLWKVPPGLLWFVAFVACLCFLFFVAVGFFLTHSCCHCWSCYLGLANSLSQDFYPMRLDYLLFLFPTLFAAPCPLCRVLFSVVFYRKNTTWVALWPMLANKKLTKQYSPCLYLGSAQIFPASLQSSKPAEKKIENIKATKRAHKIYIQANFGCLFPRNWSYGLCYR